MRLLRCPGYVAGSKRIAGSAKVNSIVVRPSSTVTSLDVSSASNSEYQTLEASPLPSYYFQKSLPRLPVPKLELTAARYLEALKPLLDSSTYLKTEAIVKDFENGVGKTLHSELVRINKDLKHTSYISEPWFKMYLKDRTPIPINVNPALVFVEDESLKAIPVVRRQLVRATNLLVSALRFMKSLDKEIIGPEIYHMNPKKSDTSSYYRMMKLVPTPFATYASYLYKAFPLDMSQYNNLFRSTRIPRKGIDEIRKADSTVRHIVVIHKGHMFTCTVLDEKGDILPAEVLQGNLAHILTNTSSPEPFPIGLLTSENRDVWAEERDHMCQNPRNKNNLEEVDRALFILSLDDAELTEDPVTVIRSFLHSDGKNRWFDKSFSLTVSKDAWAGINFEHAWGDGVAVMRFFNEIHKDSTEHKWSNNLVPRKPLIAPLKLVFELDEKSKAAILAAEKRFSGQISQLDVHPFILEKYGKKACKAWGISPDSLMQLGFQVVHYRLHGTTETTYESCSTAVFKHGRTEAIRPATMITKSISEALSKPGWESNKAAIKELIKQCSAKHNQLTKDAAMGQGFDRHLFALKNIALADGKELPPLYQDFGYSKINHNIVSTSTLASPAVKIGGFGPVVSDGYGLAYQIWDTGLGCLATTYKGQKDGAAFTAACEKVFRDLETVMSST